MLLKGMIMKEISLSKEQWRMVEKCVCLVLSQVEDLQHGFPPSMPSTSLDTKELSRIRYKLSFGYNDNGVGVTESLKGLKHNVLSEVYHVTYDHQREPADYGNYSSMENAIKWLIKHGVDTSKPQVYGNVTTFGDYRIEKEFVL